MEVWRWASEKKKVQWQWITRYKVELETRAQVLVKE